MNRWWGTSSDSDKQAADRASRAARRTIASLQTVQSDSDGDYEDCDTSLLFSNLDGADDVDEMPTPAEIAAAELARQRSLPVEDADFDNDVDSWKKEIKIKYEPHDVEYWFNAVEAEMVTFGINRQWNKKNAIIPLLPEGVVDECKPILRLPE